MNQYVTGAMIRRLREQRKLTQAQLAELLFISDKTISKWENGKGYPDISLLEPLAEVFGISVAELLSGRAVSNVNISGNMLRSRFYVCPVCGNIIHTMGEAMICCHGIQLTPCEPEHADAHHAASIEVIEDEYYLRIDHDMTKEHFITFAAALSPDRLQMVRLYPEGHAETRFQMRGVREILYFCNRDGLFTVPVHRSSKPVHRRTAAERLPPRDPSGV